VFSWYAVEWDTVTPRKKKRKYNSHRNVGAFFNSTAKKGRGVGGDDLGEKESV